MPLSPDTLNALETALGAVIDEAGDDPKYADLVSALTDAQQASALVESPAEEERDGPEDDHSFATAEKRMKEARTASDAPPADAPDSTPAE